MFTQTSNTEQSRHSALFCALDFPAFPAQVICAYHAEYRGMPVVVICQDGHSHKSLVVSCSAQARSLGMEYGMPVHEIQRRWPDVPLVRRDIALEKAACEEIAGVACRYSPEYAVRDNGSCIVNLSKTPSQRGMPVITIGARLRDDILAAVPLSAVAIGLASHEAMARVMARMARPHGICMCECGFERQTLSTLDSSVLPGLSSRCRLKLAAYGLKRIGQIQNIGKEALLSRFGAEGEKLYSLAGGGPCGQQAGDKKEFRADTVLDRDIVDLSLVAQKVKYTVDKLCFSLKNSGVLVSALTVSIRYSDSKNAQKTVTLPHRTNDFLELDAYAQQAFTALYQRRVALRSISLAAKDPQQDSCQTSLFESSWEQKQAALSRRIVEVRNKNHFESVVSGSTLL